MTEHPLLLSQPLIPPTMAGIKTCTRRLPGPTNSLVDGRRISGKRWNAFMFDYTGYNIKDGCFYFFAQSDYEWHKVEPIYETGDMIWFRENWFPAAINGDKVLIGYDPDKPDETIEITVEDTGPYWKKMERGCTIPSIHLPKEACRLWAEITSVSSEHLQDISEEQAKAEGCSAEWVKGPNTPDGPGEWEGYSAVDDFAGLWIELHGKESWNLNPPVYGINFKLTGRPGENK